MIRLQSLDGVPAEAFVFRTPTVTVQIVVCKLTVTLAQSVSRLSDVDEEIVRRERHQDGDEARSLPRPLDLVPTKRRAEVLVVGHAHAANPDGASSVVARVVVGSVDKAIEVHGPRQFGADGSLRLGTRFQRSPLGWEHACGGPETENPVGIDPTVADALGRSTLPSLQPTGLHVTQPGTAVGSVGFGPLAAAWPRRRRLLGNATGWSNGEASSDVWPDGADYAFFNAAPLDQQSDNAFRPDERLILEHLHPEHARLVTNLPGARPRAALVRGRDAREIELTFDTLWIDTDRGLATLTFRGRIDDTEDPRAVVAIALEHPGQTLRMDDLASRVAAARSARADALSGATIAAQPPAGAALPFVAADDAAPKPRSRRSGEELERLTTGTLAVESASAGTPSYGHASARIAPPPLVLGAPPERLVPAAPGESWSRPVGQRLDLPLTPLVTAPSSEEPAPHPKTLVPLRARTALAAPHEGPSTGDARVEQLWFDPSALPRFRRVKHALLASASGWVARDGAALDDRAEVHEMLVRGRTLAVADLETALDDALDRGQAHPVVAVVAGELTVGFDERAALRALLALTAPLGPTDKRFAEALVTASEVAKTEPLPSEMLIAARARLEEAFKAQARPLSFANVTDAVVRGLLESRAYQRRTVWGEERVRCTIAQDGAEVPCYLPSRAALELPMAPRLWVRVLAELRGQQDAHDVARVALAPLAIGRHWVQKEVRPG